MECPWYVATAHQKRIARDLILASDRQVTPGIWQIWQIWHFHQFHQQSDAFKSWQTWEQMDIGYEAGAAGFDYGPTILITRQQKSRLRDDKNLDYGTTKAVFATRFPFTGDPHRSSLPCCAERSTSCHCSQVPRPTWEVGRGNEPLQSG